MDDARSLLAGERVAFAYHPTTRNVPNLLRNLLLAWKLVRSLRPSIIVSTGAGVAVPFFLIGRLFGAATVFIEVVDRIETPTLTGRLCGPISSLVLLQWEEQRPLYPKGHVIGRLL
jgi:UDP-N-acetylglucosamine:LPS N-acetylglucosamine transferase